MADHRLRPDNPLVDAQPGIDHTRALIAKGMPVRLIIKKSGLNVRTVHALRRGYYTNGGTRIPTRNTTRSTLEAILAVEFEPGWDPAGFSPQKFRDLRDSRNLSRRSLAKLTGLSEWTFQWWEEGRSLPTRKKNMDAALRVLRAEWQDVSGPMAATEADEFEVSFDPEADYIPDYPCLVCGGKFRSRTLLAGHPHPAPRTKPGDPQKKKVSA